MAQHTTSDKLICEGTWNEDVAWQIYLSKTTPPEELCEAVGAVAIDSGGRIVLMRAKRGWGMLCGHREEGESMEDALAREMLEEGGFAADQALVPFAYRAITSTQPQPHPHPGRFYPHPLSYITYYLATTSKPLAIPFGDEVLESRSFTIEEAGLLATPDFPIILHGWQIYNQANIPGSNH